MGTEGISLWSPALILLGFQLTLLSMRIGREQRMGDAGKPVWIPLAEWLNLGSMMITVFLVIVPSLLGLSDVKFTRFCFAVSVGLLGGYPFALSAHYDLFGGNPATTASQKIAVPVPPPVTRTPIFSEPAAARLPPTRPQRAESATG